jgi:hypothetical protein
MMQGVGRRHVRYINSAYKRTGTLWEGRFKAALVDSDPLKVYLLARTLFELTGNSTLFQSTIPPLK